MELVWYLQEWDTLDINTYIIKEISGFKQPGIFFVLCIFGEFYKHKVLTRTSWEYNNLDYEITREEREQMTVEERKGLSNNIIQNLVLENRGKLSISGVLDVLSFDDQVVIIETELGLLTIKGEDLRINKLSIDTSEVVVEGDIYSMNYSEKELDKKSGSFLGKIFK